MRGSTCGHKVGEVQARWVSMTSASCRCRCVEQIWWHVRLLYTLLCALVVVYACSVAWLLTTTDLHDSDCAAVRAEALQTGVPQPSVSRRVRRDAGHRRHRHHHPAFYRDSSSAVRGDTVDDDEWVWMSTYSKIPVSISFTEESSSPQT